MKKCNRCGCFNENNSVFCSNCGNDLDNDVVQNNNAFQNNDVSKSNDKLWIVSLVLGILSLLFFGKFFSVVFAVGGIVTGVIARKKGSKKKIGIVFSIVVLVINVLLFVIGLIGGILLFTNKDFLNSLYNKLDYSTSDNYVAGTWNCSKFDGNGASDNYSVTMKLNKDNSFVFGAYGDLSNNHAGGSYTFEDETSKNETVTNGYKYFILNLNGDVNDYLIDGVAQNREFVGKFEMGITSVNTKKEAILMNYYTYQMYYCKID